MVSATEPDHRRRRGGGPPHRVSGTLAIARVCGSQAAVTAALDAHQDADNSARLLAVFLTERDTAGQYLLGLQVSGSLLAVIRGQHAAFQATVAQLAASIAADNTPAVASQVARLRAAEDAFYSLFLRQVPAARAGGAGLALLDRTGAASGAVIQQLRALDRLELRRAAAGQAAAARAERQALMIMIAGFALALVTVLGYAAYAQVLFRRANGRERGMTEALGRLGDRDELLARIGSTSTVLGGCRTRPMRRSWRPSRAPGRPTRWRS